MAMNSPAEAQKRPFNTFKFEVNLHLDNQAKPRSELPAFGLQSRTRPRSFLVSALRRFESTWTRLTFAGLGRLRRRLFSRSLRSRAASEIFFFRISAIRRSRARRRFVAWVRAS